MTESSRGAESAPGGLPFRPRSDRFFLPTASGVLIGCLALHQLPQIPPTAVLAPLGLLALLALWVARGAGFARWAAVCVLAFCWAGWLAAQGLSARIDPTLEGDDVVLTGAVAGLPQATAYGTRFTFLVEDCPTLDSGCPRGYVVRLSWPRSFSRGASAFGRDVPTEPSELRPGDRWQLNVRLRLPLASINPGLFDAELRFLEEGIVALGSIRRARHGDLPNVRLDGRHSSLSVTFERARQAGLTSLGDALGEVRSDARGVLLALAFGDQTAIATRDWELFNHTGVAHLMSISGLHITMLAALAALATRWLLGSRVVARSGLLLWVSAPTLQWAAALISAFCYAGLAGWGIPAQRTCWMLAATAWALTQSRHRGIIPVLSLAAAVVCVMDPWAPLASGFWLSFATVGVIAMASGFHQRTVSTTGSAARNPDQQGSARLPAVGRWLQGRWLVNAIRSQWAATLCLLPLGAVFFSTVSLLSPIANAFAIPLVSGFVTPAVLVLALISLLSPELASLLAPCAGLPVQWLLDALRMMRDWPVGVGVLATPDAISLALALGAVLMLLAPRPVPWRPLWAVGLVPLWLCGPERPAEGGFRMTALDVGQGMAVLIETQGRRLLYDTGPAWDPDADAGARVLVPWLRSRGIAHIDTVIVSHADIDHAGGLASVLRHIRVREVMSSLQADHPLIQGLDNHRPCRRGQYWVWNKVRFDLLHPGDEFPPGAARSPTNAVSCVVRVSSSAGTALLAGDIEARQETALVERFGSGLRSDLLLVPHHGSNTSSTETFLATVAPRIAVIQVGYRNRFRHPTAKVLARYEAAGAGILRTDLHGAVEVSFDGATGEVRSRLSRLDPQRYWRVIPPGSLATGGS